MFDTNKGMEEAAAFWDAGHEWQGAWVSVSHVASLCWGTSGRRPACWHRRGSWEGPGKGLLCSFPVVQKLCDLSRGAVNWGS